MLTINNTFSRRRDNVFITLTFEIIINVPRLPIFDVPTSLYVFKVPRPCPTHPRVPYLMFPSPSSRIPNISPHTRVPMSPSPCPRSTFIHSPIKFRICKQNSKPQTYYRCCLRSSYLARYWLMSRNTITFHKCFSLVFTVLWVSQ